MPTDGRWGWYRDHNGNEFQRVSTLIKKVETDDFYLRMWEKRQVLIGAGARDDLVLAVKAMKPHPVTGWSRAQKSDINKLVEKAEEAAKSTDGAITGTARHTLTERLDRGEDIESVVRGLPAQVEADLRAYEALVRLNGWEMVAIERTVVCDELDVAGSLDRVTLIPGLTALLGPGRCQHGCGVGGPGEGHGDELPVVMDVKAERDPTQNGLHIGPQLAIYSRAQRMWVPANGYTREPTPPRYVDALCVRQDVAVVVHIRDGHATPYFVDVESGWDAALAARVQAEREKAARRWLAPMPQIKEPPPAAVLVATAVHQGAQKAIPLTLPPVEQPGVDPGVLDRLTALPDFSGTLKGVVEQVAVEVADGMVGWQPTGIVSGEGHKIAVVGNADDMLSAARYLGALDDVDRQAIETVWSSADLGGLHRVFEIYTKTVGRAWGGRVAEAAEARRRQIECVQRELHTPTAQAIPGTKSKCACGWTATVLP